MAPSAAAPRAIFSTKLGKISPRDLSYPLPPVIARSNGSRQVTDYASQLRGQFPLHCNQIFHISSLCDYFDRYDIHLQSPDFLAAVLNHIIQGNLTNVKDFAHDWSVAHRFELIKLCEPVSVENIFDTNVIERYGVIFLTIALQHMRNSLATLSKQQAMAKHVDANYMCNQHLRDDLGSNNMANSLNIGHEKTAVRKNNYLSNTSKTPAGLGYQKLPKNVVGSCSSDGKYHIQRRKGSEEVLSKIDPAVIHNGQSVPSQRSYISPNALQDLRHPSEQHWNVQIHGCAPDFWASPNERGTYRSPRSETQGSRHMNANWYSGCRYLYGKQYHRNGYSQVNSFNVMTAHDRHINSASYNNLSPMINYRNRSMLESLSSNGSSPSQINGSTPSMRSTDSFSSGWPSYVTSKPFGPGIVVRSQRRTSYNRQSLGAASKWQNINNHATLLQNNSNRRLSMGSNFDRPVVFDHGISYKPHNIIPKEGYPINQDSGSYDLRMAKSRSLNSSNYQGTFLKNNSDNVQFESATSDIAIKADPDYFCDKHTIGNKRDDVRTIWVTSIQNASSEELTALFSSCGTVEDIDFRNVSVIASRYAFIRFGSSDEARESLKLHGTIFRDKYLSVQVPRKYWTLSSTHDHSKYGLKSNNNNSLPFISGTRPSLPSCWPNLPPSGHMNLPRFYSKNQYLDYLSNYSNIGPSQPDWAFSRQSSHFPNEFLPGEIYQSQERQNLNFDVAAGCSAGNPNFHDFGQNAYGVKFNQRAGAHMQSRNNGINKKFRSNSVSGLNEKQLAQSKFKGDKYYSGYSKPSAPDDIIAKEIQPRSTVGSNDHNINVDKDTSTPGGEDQVNDAKVSVQTGSEPSGETFCGLARDTVVESLPVISTTDSKVSSDSTIVKSSQLDKQVDQHIELAFSEINSVEISLTSAKVNNCLDISPHASGIGLDDNGNCNDPINLEFQDCSEKRSSFKNEGDVPSTHTSDIPGNNEAILESHWEGQEMKGLAVNTFLQESQISNSIPNDEIPNAKTPLPMTICTENGDACASTIKNSLKEANTVMEALPTEKEPDTSDIASTNARIIKKEYDPGRTYSIHPFARTKNMKKKGKKISKVTQLEETVKTEGTEVSKSKVPNKVAKMPSDACVANVSGKTDNMSKTPSSLGNSITGPVVDDGDRKVNCGLLVSRIKSNKAEFAKGQSQSEGKLQSGNHIGRSSTVTTKPTNHLSRPDGLTPANVREETCLEICELEGNKKLYPTPLAHKEFCVSTDERSAVKESAEVATNEVSPLPISNVGINGTESKASTLKKKKKKRSSRSKTLSATQPNTQPIAAQETASEATSKSSLQTETESRKTKAVAEVHNGEYDKGVAGLGLVIADSAVASSSSATSLVHRTPISATDGITDGKNPNSDSDAYGHGNEIPSQISASSIQDDDRRKDSIRADSAVERKSIYRGERSQNANGGSSGNQQQDVKSAAIGEKEAEFKGQKEQRPALHVQHVSYAAAAAAMAVAGEMAKAVKRSALSDHSRAVKETLIRLEKLHEKEMMEKAGGLSGSAPASASAFASQQ